MWFWISTAIESVNILRRKRQKEKNCLTKKSAVATTYLWMIECAGHSITYLRIYIHENQWPSYFRLEKCSIFVYKESPMLPYCWTQIDFIHFQTILTFLIIYILYLSGSVAGLRLLGQDRLRSKFSSIFFLFIEFFSSLTLPNLFDSKRSNTYGTRNFHARFLYYENVIVV